jgi:hypothetical protein
MPWMAPGAVSTGGDIIMGARPQTSDGRLGGGSSVTSESSSQKSTRPKTSLAGQAISEPFFKSTDGSWNDFWDGLWNADL